MWLFRAYKNEKCYDLGEFFFEKTFTNHEELKTFSANHSYENKKKYPEYCSMYWKIK